MTCPFQDPTQGSLCLVLRIAGDAPPVCTEERSDDDRTRGYRDCAHYGTAIRGGLARILRNARKGRTSDAAAEERAA